MFECAFQQRALMHCRLQIIELLERKCAGTSIGYVGGKRGHETDEEN